MAEARRVTFHRRAAMALDAFSPQDRARIADAARLLEAPGDRAALEAKTAKLAMSQPVYVMRATPAIRLIYRRTAEGFEVLDVVKKATLQNFLKKAAGPAKSLTGARPVKAAPARGAKPAAKAPVGTSNR